MRIARWSLSLLVLSSACSLLNAPAELRPADDGMAGDPQTGGRGDAGETGAGGAAAGSGSMTSSGGKSSGGDEGSSGGKQNSAGGQASGGDEGNGGSPGNGGDGSGGAPAELTYAKFFGAFAELACERTLYCESKLGLGALLEILCHPRIAEQFLDLIGPGFREAFEPAPAQRCLDRLAVVDCSVYNSTFDPACDFLFRSYLEVGDTCRGDDACRDGYCKQSETDCSGSCVEAGETDAPCTTSEECKDSFFCSLQSGGSGTCQPRGADNAPCLSTSECQELFWCHKPTGASSSTAGRCERLPDIGEECELDLGGDPCRGSLVCTDTGGTEKQCTTGVGLDGACDYDHPCRPGFRCSDTTDRCVALGGNGDRCDSKENCPAGFQCFSEMCRPEPGLGDTCGAQDECIQGVCDAGKCALLDDGATCTGGTGIFATCKNYCDETSQTCVPLESAGSTCLEDAECEAGTACIGPEAAKTCVRCN